MCWQALRGKDTWCPYSVNFPLLAFTGPNTCLQTPAAQPINHCRLTQYNRKFAEGAQLGHYQCSVPIYFASALFSEADVTKLMCHSLKTETVDCDVVRRNNGSNRRVELIWIWVFFLFIHRLLSLTSRESVHNYAHHTLAPSLFPETFCHVTSGRKWHFNILSSDHVWGAIMAWCMFLWEHVSFSKSHPLIFDSFLSMQTVPLSPTLSGKL